MDKSKKEQVVASLKDSFSNAETVVVTHYKGMSVAEITQLRRSMPSGTHYVVTKNNLALRALEGTEYANLADMFAGPTAIAVSSDPVSAAKAVVDFAKNNEKLVIIGGAMSNKVMSVKEIESLAKLPSLDELRAKLLAMLNTPATRIAGVVQAPAGQIARVVGAYSKKEE